MKYFLYQSTYFLGARIFVVFFYSLCSITWVISTASSRSSMACECPPKRKCAQALARAEVQRTSASVSIRQHTSAYVSIRQHMACECPPKRKCAQALARAEVQHTSAYVSIRQHPSASVSIRQHPSASVSIRQHPSAYVSIRQHT